MIDCVLFICREQSEPSFTLGGSSCSCSESMPEEATVFSEGLGRNRSTFKAVLYGLVIESMMVIYSGFSDKAETVLFEVL